MKYCSVYSWLIFHIFWKNIVQALQLTRAWVPKHVVERKYKIHYIIHFILVWKRGLENRNVAMIESSLDVFGEGDLVGLPIWVDQTSNISWYPENLLIRFFCSSQLNLPQGWIPFQIPYHLLECIFQKCFVKSVFPKVFFPKVYFTKNYFAKYNFQILSFVLLFEELFVPNFFCWKAFSIYLIFQVFTSLFLQTSYISFDIRHISYL